MEFNGYLKYADYLRLGGTLKDKNAFNLLEFEVRKIIDRRTQGRLINVEEVPLEVKLCVNKMIGVISTYIYAVESHIIKGGNGNIASENTDGYSVSYVTTDQVLEKAQEIIKSKNAELEDIMLNYLSTTIINGEPILYLGVR